MVKHRVKFDDEMEAMLQRLCVMTGLRESEVMKQAILALRNDLVARGLLKAVRKSVRRKARARNTGQ